MVRMIGRNSLLLALAALGAFASVLPAKALDWPQWRGPDRTDVSRETNLLKRWPANGPNRLWLYRQAGPGYSGFSVARGKVLTMITRDDMEQILALDEQSGRELWVVAWKDGGDPDANRAG